MGLLKTVNIPIIRRQSKNVGPFESGLSIPSDPNRQKISIVADCFVTVSNFLNNHKAQRQIVVWISFLNNS